MIEERRHRALVRISQAAARLNDSANRWRQSGAGRVFGRNLRRVMSGQFGVQIGVNGADGGHFAGRQIVSGATADGGGLKIVVPDGELCIFVGDKVFSRSYGSNTSRNF